MPLRSTITRTILRLPDPVLIRLSGGKPLMISGHTLDARLQFLDHAARSRPALHTLPPEQARAGVNRFWADIAAEPEPGVKWEDREIRARGKGVRVRIYRPDHQNARRPVIVYAHMGGGVIGGLETCHAFCSLLSARTGAPLISVDYRLAPEHRFPAGLEDVLSAYEWALSHAAGLGAPAGRAAIGGDSMGGNFAAVICQECRREGLPQPALQLLIYPALDMAQASPAYATYGDLVFLSRATMDWFTDLYLPPGTDPTIARLSPGRHLDLEGLAPALIYTAGFDPLREDGPAYARALREDLVEAPDVCFETLAHGFTAFMGICPAARAACRRIAGDVATALAAQDG